MAWIDGTLGKIRFPLLSDLTKVVSRDYGVLLEKAGIALRGAFIIDPDGILKWQVVHDTNTGRSVDEICALCKRCRPAVFARQTGRKATKP
jgi:alkyl hydroperoxide reductase subunit AhpC